MLKKTNLNSIPLRWWASVVCFIFILIWVAFPVERTKRWINSGQFKIGEASHKTVISPLDFSYPDMGATQKVKEQVIEDVPLVYDLSLEYVSDADQMFDEILKIRGQKGLSISQKLSLMKRLIIGESLSIESSKISIMISDKNFERVRAGVGQSLKEVFSHGVVKKLGGSDSDSFAQNLAILQPRGELWKREHKALASQQQGEVADAEVALQMPIELRIAGAGVGVGKDRKSLIAGELYDREEAISETSKKANLRFGSDSQIRGVVSEICRWFIRPNLNYNQQETELLRKSATTSVKIAMRSMHKGDRIVSRGEVVSQEQIRILDALEPYQNRLYIFSLIGTAVAVIFLTTILAVYLKVKEPQILQKPRKLLTLCILLILTISLGRLIVEYVPLSEPALLIPTALTSMVVAIIMSTQLAVLVTVVLGILIGIMIGPESQSILEHFAVPFLGGMVAIFSVSSVRKRSDLIKAGLYVATANGIAIVGISLMRSQSLLPTAENALTGVVNGVMVGMLSPGFLPIFEKLAQTTTDIELLELSDLNHPLLAELKSKAPGSYYHSIEVSKLCEAAAESINANALLARVGSYYHDIGKINMPKYFIENQEGYENIHDKISPYTSARIISSHVKDGIELAKEHRLPKIIEDLIPQHHGTSMISFFYQKALESEGYEDIHEGDYRYPGPKPQTKEAGIMLLADSVEASSRNLKAPTYLELQSLVEDIINQKTIDSQLDENGLTLKDLRAIANSFVQVLSNSSHLRIEYPKSGEKKEEKSALLKF